MPVVATKCDEQGAKMDMVGAPAILTTLDTTRHQEVAQTGLGSVMASKLL